MILFKTELINIEDTLEQMTHKIEVISFIIETNTKTEKATTYKMYPLWFHIINRCFTASCYE